MPCCTVLTFQSEEVNKPSYEAFLDTRQVMSKNLFGCGADLGKKLFHGGKLALTVFYLLLLVHSLWYASFKG